MAQSKISSAQASFVVRIPKPLHRWLKSRAARRGVSLNALCTAILDEFRFTDQNPESGKLKAIGHKIEEWLGAQLVGIILFGSQARRDAWADSDYDLLIVLADHVKIDRELYRTWDLLGLEDAISPHFVHPPESGGEVNTLFLEAALEGRVILDKQALLATFLNSLRSRIAAGMYRRSLVHGQPAWNAYEESNTGGGLR